MTQFEYGPAELIVARFDGDAPSPGVVQTIFDLVRSGTVRLLDFLIVRRQADGSVEIIELEDIGDEIGLTDLTLDASGLTGDEDVQSVANLLQPGSTGAVLVIEHTWAKDLAGRFFAAGGEVMHSERIPAPVVNAVVTGDYASVDPATAG